jgi:hypothetical protein
MGEFYDKGRKRADAAYRTALASGKLVKPGGIVDQNAGADGLVRHAFGQQVE